jgi:hypothetical protein
LGRLGQADVAFGQVDRVKSLYFYIQIQMFP